MAPDAPIQVTFDRAMDHASVEQRLQLRPPIAGCDPALCAVTWNGDVLSLRHAGHELTPATHYNVVLHRGYRDAMGQANSFDHAWDFSTESAPALSSSTPADNAIDVAVDADLVLQFSRAVRLPADSDVAIEPAVAVSLRLDPADPSRLIVAPLRLLQPATSYTVSLAATILDQHNAPMGRARQLHFTTARVSLLRSLAFAAGAAGDGAGSRRRVVELRPPPTLQSRPQPSASCTTALERCWTLAGAPRAAPCGCLTARHRGRCALSTLAAAQR